METQKLVLKTLGMLIVGLLLGWSLVPVIVFFWLLDHIVGKPEYPAWEIYLVRYRTKLSLAEHTALSIAIVLSIFAAFWLLLFFRYF